MKEKIELEGATVEIQKATQYYVHEKYNYGIFCISDIGDLYLNSDYGFYGCSWRHYGKDFKQFLMSCNAEYVFDKFEQNHMYLTSKKLPKHVHAPVMVLFKLLQEALKQELQVVEK